MFSNKAIQISIKKKIDVNVKSPPSYTTETEWQVNNSLKMPLKHAAQL